MKKSIDVLLAGVNKPFVKEFEEERLSMCVEIVIDGFKLIEKKGKTTSYS